MAVVENPIATGHPCSNQGACANYLYIMKPFSIDPIYLRDVHVTNSITSSTGEMIRVYSCIDHPTFTALRERLYSEGFIHITTGVWNADKVLQPFVLNGRTFNKGDTFCCAAAMKFVLERLGGGNW